MKVIFTILFAIVYSVLSGQQNNCKVIINTKGVPYKNKVVISLFRNNPKVGIELLKKVKPTGPITVIYLNTPEPFWSFVTLSANDSVLISSSDFLITNAVIKVQMQSLNHLPIVTGGENVFISKHRLLLFALPNAIAISSGYSLASVKEKYEFNPSDIRLKLYWQEYEAGIIENISAHKNFYFILEKLAEIRSKLPVRTLENCFDLLSDTLKKTSLGKELNSYILQSKKIVLKEKAPYFIVWDEFSNSIQSNAVYSGSKYVLLDFWASWCLPCREKMKEFKKKYADIDTSLLQMISISIDTKKNNWLTASEFEQIPWKNYIDTTGVIEKKFTLDYIPQNIMISPAGKIVAFNLWGAELDSFLKKNNLLKKK